MSVADATNSTASSLEDSVTSMAPKDLGGSLPLDAYTLLGLDPLESDKQRIQAAIDNQRRGPRSGSSAGEQGVGDRQQRIELAIRTLASPYLKALLDAALKRLTAAFVPPRDLAQAKVVCRHCQTTNLGTQPYCCRCGERLWELCPRCNTVCDASLKFCGQCGVDRQHLTERQIEEAEATLRQAQELLREHEYQEAEKLLYRLASNDRPHLDAQASSALVTLEQIAPQRQQAEREVAQELLAARQLIESHRRDEGLAILSNIPRALRTAEVEQLAASCQQGGGELDQLLAQFRELVRGKNPLKALSLVRRLLSLHPDQPAVLRKLPVLRQRACRVAHRHIKAYDYDAALTLLEQLPEDHRDGTTIKLIEYAREQQWLVADVKRTPFVDPTLVHVIRRLCRTAPESARYQALRQRLVKICGAEDHVPSAPQRPVWVLPKDNALLRFPVQWQSDTHELTGMEIVAGVAFPERDLFWTAIGLALRGVELAAVSLDLVNSDSKGMLGMLSQNRRKPRTAWGIDVGTTAIKAVRLTHDPGTSRTSIDQVLHLPCPVAKLADGGAAHGWLREALAQLRTQICDKNARLCFNLPGNRTIGRFFEMPEMPAKKQQQAVRVEAQHRFPSALEDLVWGHHALATLPASQQIPVRQQRVAMVAAKKLFVNQFLATLAEVQLSASLVQSSCVALHNFLIQQYYRGHDADPPNGSAGVSRRPIALLDVGASASNLVLSSPEHFWFRTLSFGVNQITSALVSKLKLTHQQADQLLRQPWRTRRLTQVYEVATPLLRQLSDEVQRSLNMYPHAGEITQMIGGGGGFRFHGLPRFLCHGR